LYNWKNVLLRPEDSIEHAIKILDKEALRIVLVINANNKLLGTVTDGDIRRALIRHCTMDSKVSNIMCKEPTTASIHDDRIEIRTLMKKKGLLQIPLLDDCGRVFGLETLQNLGQHRQYDNPVFLMAGGFGTRLHPLTLDVPKPLLKVGPKPILETILDQFISAGFHNFYISTHYKSEMVRDYFKNGDQWGVNIEYVHEDSPLGTAGALGLLPDNLPQLPIILMNGDLLTKVNFEHLLQYHIEQGCIATMCVREYDFQVPYGVVQVDDYRVKDIVEKPVHSFFVNGGIYVLESSLCEVVKKNERKDMTDLLQEQINKGMQVNMFPVHEYWLDIGRMEDYERANSAINEV